MYNLLGDCFGFLRLSHPFPFPASFSFSAFHPFSLQASSGDRPHDLRFVCSDFRNYKTAALPLSHGGKPFPRRIWVLRRKRLRKRKRNETVALSMLYYSTFLTL